MNANRSAWILAIGQTLAWSCLSSVFVAAQETPSIESQVQRLASRMVESSGRSGGVCALVGVQDATLPIALGRQGPFVVQCLAADGASCDRLRDAIRAAGCYGTVSADVLDGDRLPYTDNLVNLLVVDDFPEFQRRGLSLADVHRVLTPLGTAFVRVAADSPARAQLARQAQGAGLDSPGPEPGDEWVALHKPWPAEIDQWTHYLHGADGNPVARDRVVAPPEHYQWIADPMWQRSHETDSTISTLVTAQGRLFYIVDEAPISLTGQHALPDKWMLAARDAFNGVDLWKVPIRRWGWREWKETWFSNRPGDFPLNIQKRLVAVGDRVYVTLGYHAPVSQLDARTGQILQVYEGTERTNEILVVQGTLILAVLADDGVRVMAVDAASGQTRWTTPHAYRGTAVDYLKWSGQGGGVKPAKLDPSLNMATDGQIIALIDGPDIVGLDFQTGDERWRTAFPSAETDQTAGGIRSNGDLWIGTMIVSDGVAVHASPGKLAALAAGDGRVLWEQPKSYIGHLWYEWKDVFVIGGLVWTWSDQLDEAVIAEGGQRRQRALWPRTVNGYDLKTGELKKEVPLGNIFRANHHHRCYRNKATERFILASRRGTEYVDLQDGQHTVHNWVRGTCHVGMMPANGLQYAPPHPCACYIDEKLNGMNALAPAIASPDRTNAAEEGEREAEPESGRLERGPVYAELQQLESAGAGPEDWTTFRADSRRTGSVATSVPDDAAELWRVRVGAKVSPPIAVGDRVYAALIDQHQVVCLDARDGRTLWQFAAGARVDSPPTYHDGSVLFGSADGGVYCLRAEDGRLAWRFRAAPQRRLIGAFGQLESAWPVHGSVLVQNGVAYFAAGRSSQLDGGIFLFGLDARTGQVRCERRLQGPDYKIGDFDENFGLPMGSLPDILIGDGTRVVMRDEVFDADLQPVKAKPATDLQARSGLLEDSYFKRTPWTADGEYARLIVRDNRSVYYVRMFDSLRGLDPTVFFTPGRNGYLLFARGADGRRSAWTQRVPVRIRAMVAAGDRLIAAGPPDVVDPSDPLGAFEGRKGGLLYAIDSGTGEHAVERELPSPPVFNGAAAARGRLFLALEDGSLVGYGKR